MADPLGGRRNAPTASQSRGSGNDGVDWRGDQLGTYKPFRKKTLPPAYRPMFEPVSERPSAIVPDKVTPDKLIT